MANIKSAKKRVLIDRRNAERNKAVKSEIKTAVKKIDAAIAENNKEEAATALVAATSIISKAAAKGILHKQTASRKIARLSVAVNKIA